MNDVNNPDQRVVSVTDWVLTILISSIPIVNIVMLFVWAFGESTNVNKANWAKATLIWIAISIGLLVVFGMIFGLFALISNQF
jgi:hypothetical protein